MLSASTDLALHRSVPIVSAMRPGLPLLFGIRSIDPCIATYPRAKLRVLLAPLESCSHRTSQR